jgi:hypothetical protein
MLSAFAVSSLFLALYVLHKASRGFESTTFQVEGAARVAYLVLLFTHVTLAMTVPPLAVALVALGLSDRRERHRRLARIAWPIWMYVSVTGVVIYLLLYHLHPAPPESRSGRVLPALFHLENATGAVILRAGSTGLAPAGVRTVRAEDMAATGRSRAARPSRTAAPEERSNQR